MKIKMLHSSVVMKRTLSMKTKSADLLFDLRFYPHVSVENELLIKRECIDYISRPAWERLSLPPGGGEEEEGGRGLLSLLQRNRPG